MGSTAELKPWVYGPFELIDHAEGHLNSGSDFDKRIALIGYDNAIEVSITTFLNLHPRQRGGKTFSREMIDKWLTNYHTKLDFLENYLKDNELSADISIDEIIFVHTLRNELYHSGNGMVPEERVLNKAQTIAKLVFSVLFRTEPDLLLAKRASSRYEVASFDPKYSGHMQFLQSFIELEDTLRSVSNALVISETEDFNRRNLLQLLDQFIDRFTNFPGDFKNKILQAKDIRNKFVHGEPIELSENDLINLSREVNRISNYLKTYICSTNLLPALRELYPKWIRPEIHSVRIIHKSNKVFLETAIKTGVLSDEEIILTDLDFIGDSEDKGEDLPLFPPSKSAQDNAKNFLKMDPYSLYVHKPFYA